MAGQYQFGKKALMDALKNQLEVQCVYLGAYNQSLIQTCLNHQIKYKVVEKSWFNRFERTLNHQFIAFELAPSKAIDLSRIKMNLNQFLVQNKNKPNLTVVILDEIEDARNFGAILRSCAGFEIDAVIYKKDHQAPLNDLAIKTSMGAINYLNLIEVANLTASLKLLKEHGFWIYGTMLDTTAQSLYKTEFSARCGIVFGNENKGISDLVAKNLDFKTYIPMTDAVQSLNVSVATGICLAYIYHQRTKK